MKLRLLAGIAAGTLVAVTLLGLEVLSFLGSPSHHGGPWNEWPLWDLVWGFAGAAALVGLGIRILKPALSRPENHYHREGDR